MKLGIGLDLPWGEKRFAFSEHDGGTPTADVLAHLERFTQTYDYGFLAFQPRGYAALDASRYLPAYDRFYAALGENKDRVFHHTLLNTGAPHSYDKDAVAEFTNTVINRYNIRWVVEDLGIWSLNGKSLPYPLPPILTENGRDQCVANVAQWVSRLDTELSIEFPGFTEGGSFMIGHLDAFEFFADVVREAGCLATVDVGHILAYQWLTGRTGPAMYEGIDKLPLERCIEIHLSGCQIVDGRFRDLHHGVLLDEQIDLLEYLLTITPNLRGVTYEDPKFDAVGELVPKSRFNAQRLFDMVAQHGRSAA